jgi:hypothetical protein
MARTSKPAQEPTLTENLDGFKAELLAINAGISELRRVAQEIIVSLPSAASADGEVRPN